MHSPGHLQRFSALCRHCGPALFQFHVGQDADHDPLWCTLCGHEYQWQEAEAYWLETADTEEPERSATSEPLSHSRQPATINIPARKEPTLSLALVASLLLALLFASVALPILQGSLPKIVHRPHHIKSIAVGS